MFEEEFEHFESQFPPPNIFRRVSRNIVEKSKNRKIQLAVLAACAAAAITTIITLAEMPAIEKRDKQEQLQFEQCMTRFLGTTAVAHLDLNDHEQIHQSKDVQTVAQVCALRYAPDLP